MKDKVFFNEGFFEYSGSKKEIGIGLYCTSFKLKISDIKYIVLSPRLVLDDEECFLVFVDINYKKFILPLFYVENLSDIEEYFRIKTIREIYSRNLSHNNHYGKTDKIIYPKELFWEDLYKKDWKLFVRGFYSWILPKSFFGSIIKR